MNIGFLGLGKMGTPIARHLMAAGHQLVVYNRTRAKADELAAAGAKVAGTPIEAADAEVVFSMLADDQAVDDLFFRDGCLSVVKNVHVSLSTISIAMSKRLEAAHAKNRASFVSSPVFGRPEAAAAAKLVVVAAGTPEAVEKVKPLLAAIGQKVVVVGAEPWKANMVKLSGNFMIATLLETLSEAFALVEKSDIDRGMFLDIVNGLFQSPVYENYGRAIVAGAFEPAGFQLKLGLKDVRLVLAAADTQAVPLPLASVVHDQLLAAYAQGKGEIDWAALSLVAAMNAGLRR